MLRLIIILITVSFFSFCFAGCSENEAIISPEKDLPEKDPVPAEAISDILVEPDTPDEEPQPVEYDFYLEVDLSKAYLEILKEKSGEISSPRYDGLSYSEIAILDVFGDETPELLYIYRHTSDSIAEYSVIIITYSEQEGTKSVFDSIVSVAAGGPDFYCVYLTLEGELMLYHSPCSGPGRNYGFWQITPDRNLKTGTRYGGIVYNSDLAKLYYDEYYSEGEACLKTIYKENGKIISEQQFYKTAEEIMGDIDCVIFSDPDLYEHDLWKDITPFEVDNMTYAEAVAWLEASIR